VAEVMLSMDRHCDNPVIAFPPHKTNPQLTPY